MILKEVIKSKLDGTSKFLFVNNDRQVLEIAYIDHFDNKNSVCVPTQSACGMACRFCHTTDVVGKIPVTNLWSGEIVEGVKTVFDSLNLIANPKPLLVSFMGCGEPLLNDWEVLQATRALASHFNDDRVPDIRFSMATMMPKGSFPTFVKFGETIKAEQIPFKVHLSLHFTEEFQRGSWMPRAESIVPSVNLLEWYRNRTGNPVEVHYTLIEGVNDTDVDIWRLKNLLQGRSIPIKFLRFNPKPGQPYQPSPVERVGEFAKWLGEEFDITTECYTPPGTDIGASCGQFLMDYYVKIAKGE